MRGLAAVLHPLSKAFEMVAIECAVKLGNQRRLGIVLTSVKRTRDEEAGNILYK